MTLKALMMNSAAPVWAPDDGAGAGAAGGYGGSGGDAGAGAGDAGAGGQSTALGGDGNGDAGGQGDGGEGGNAGDGQQSNGDGSDVGDAGDGGEGDGSPAELKLTAPEGMENFQGEFDTYSSEASEWMQANPNATAADALKWAAERQAEAVTTQTQDMSEAFTRQIETWEGEAKADKDIGGDAFDANLATAKKAIDAFGSDGLKAVLNESGLGSHPEVIKFAVNAGKALADAPVIKTGDGAAKKSLADSLYGKKT